MQLHSANAHSVLGTGLSNGFQEVLLLNLHDLAERYHVLHLFSANASSDMCSNAGGHRRCVLPTKLQPEKERHFATASWPPRLHRWKKTLAGDLEAVSETSYVIIHSIGGGRLRLFIYHVFLFSTLMNSEPQGLNETSKHWLPATCKACTGPLVCTLDSLRLRVVEARGWPSMASGHEARDWKVAGYAHSQYSSSKDVTF